MNIKSFLLNIWNLWPPFFFSGIKIVDRSKDFRHFKVKLKLRFWTANYLGTQYGGSIFSMADPFYMIMLIKNLGKEYSIWDKSASVRYLKPGKTDLYAEFNLSEEDLKTIREEVEQNGRMYWTRNIEIKDMNGEVIAHVERTIAIRKQKK